MRGANGVDAELAEDFEAALPGGEGDGGAEGAGVGVHGCAEDFVVDAVEEEALVGVEVELADAEGDVFGVDCFAVAEEGGVGGVDLSLIHI